MNFYDTQNSLNHSDLVVHVDTIKSPIRVKERLYDATTHIGLRPTQEDRFILVPEFFSKDAIFAGVFDGTVGPDASEYLKTNVCRHLCEANEIGDVVKMMNQEEAVANEHLAKKINVAMRDTFIKADRSLIAMCAEKQLHYASSTGVCAFLWKNLLTIAHVGDSKACIAKVYPPDQLQAEWLTIDHKPNMPNELRRIEESGGSLAWLHENKPYIRGGDFFARKARNEHPKQLNYSRAFGGKDLKMYGLTAEPDVNHFQISEEDKLVLIASDGLWDVLNPDEACRIALNARAQGRSATDAVVRSAIHEMPICGVRDNITVIALFLND